MKLNDLKERLNIYGKTYEQKIVQDPQYAPAIDKLRIMVEQRDKLRKQLNKLDIDIDMILAIIGASEEKKQLDKELK